MRASAAHAPSDGAGVPGRITDLVRALRSAGVPTSVADGLDAVRAAGLVDLADREQLRAALAAALVKTARHRPAFDVLFDLHFPPRPDLGAEADEPDRDVADLLAALVRAVLDDDGAAIDRLAREAVGSFGGMSGRDGSTSWYASRVFGRISTEGLLRRLVGAAEVGGDDLADRLARDELQARLRRFRAGVEAEARRRQAARRGVEAVARTAVRPLPEEQDLLRVTAAEEAELRRAVVPLARRLATVSAVRRRRARTGRLDMRRTLRAALSTGGVPVDPAFRRPRPARPDLVLLCDVSGSVAAFARFSLLLTAALHGQVTRVRSFAFVDALDEVTDLFGGADPSEAVRRLATQARVVRLDGRSDYGAALTALLERHAEAVTPRTTLLVLGDARNNHRPARAEALAELHRRARFVCWLNPEPAATWDTGDSIMSTYAAHTDLAMECRTLRQLAEVVEALGRGAPLARRPAL